LPLRADTAVTEEDVCEDVLLNLAEPCDAGKPRVTVLSPIAAYAVIRLRVKRAADQ
jgi:hypothetical protein